MNSLEVNDYDELVSQKITHRFTWKIGTFLTSGGFGTVFNIKRFGDPKPYIVKFENCDSISLLSEQNFYRKILKIKPRDVNILPLITTGLNITVNKIEQRSIILPKMRYSLYNYYFANFTYFNTFCLKIIRVLEFINSLKYVHNDIKPENIVFDNIWEPYIIDFGLIKNYELSNYERRESNVLGSLYYMSTDIHRGIVSQRTDLISFGFVLYTLLEDQPELPWERASFTRKYENMSNSQDQLYYDMVDEKEKFIENYNRFYYKNELLNRYFKIVTCRNYDQRPYYSKIYDLFKSF